MLILSSLRLARACPECFDVLGDGDFCLSQRIPQMKRITKDSLIALSHFFSVTSRWDLPEVSLEVRVDNIGKVPGAEAK